jgi:HemY protein
MMKILIFVAIILVGLCISPMIIDNTGYVYLAVGEYQIETSLVVASATLLVAFIALTLAKWLFGLAFKLMLTSKHLPLRWRQSSAKKNTLQGAIAMAAEDWPLAEKSMLKGAADGELTTLNLLVAAHAAHQQKKAQARDEYLDSASAEPLALEAISISKVRYLMQDKEFSLAGVELEKLTPTSKSPDAVLRLALALYPIIYNWQGLKSILAVLPKRQLISSENYAKLTLAANYALLEQACNKNAQELEKCWQWLPKTERQQPEILLLYIQGLIKFGLKEEGHKQLVKLVKNEPSPLVFKQLADFVDAQDDDIRKQLARHESSFENDADFQACLAKLSLQTRDAKEAKLRWQNACRISPTVENLVSLAQVQEQLGENSNAFQTYRQAVQKT